MWDKCKVKEFDVSSVVMSSRSSFSFFKKPVNTVNNGADAVNIPENSCTVADSDVKSENVSSASNWFSLPEKPYHPSKNFVFPKTKFESRNPMVALWHWKRSCSLFSLHEERIRTDSREKQRTSIYIGRI